MTIEQERSATSASAGGKSAHKGAGVGIVGPALPRPARPHRSESTAPQDALVRSLTGDAPVAVARAPRMLDCLGGLADFAGALQVMMPVASGVIAAAQQRTDDALVVSVLEGDQPLELVHLEAAQWQGSSPAIDLLGDLRPNETLAAGHVAALVQLARQLLIAGGSDRPRGLAFAVAADGDDPVSITPASLVAACLAALTATSSNDLDLARFAEVCAAAETAGIAAGAVAGGSICARLAQAGRLSVARCDPATPGQQVPIPNGVRFVGIDSAHRDPDFALKYARMRIASQMGAVLINKIIAHNSNGDLRWDGYLSRVSMTDYVDRFRDRLPTKLRGSEFTKRFGDISDEWMSVEPGFAYKVRSRSEHQIYEHGRSQQFVESLVRAARTKREDALVAAGEVMHASHWSYGQRCGLGSHQTDLLQNLLRTRGTAHGIYGARISERGGGGIVVAMIRDDERAMDAVRSAAADYEAETGLTTAILDGTSDGIDAHGIVVH